MLRNIRDLLNPYHLARFRSLIKSRVPFVDIGKTLDVGEHLLYFNPVTTNLGTDGYFDDQSPRAISGDPGLKYLRRVWAQGTIDVARPLLLSQSYTCRESLQYIKKIGGDHYVGTERLVLGEDSNTLLRETRTLAYTNALAKDYTLRQIDWRNSISLGSFTFNELDIVMYGQLSLNPHRIHWDHNYAREVEGYKTIIVQGPFALQILLAFAQGYVKRPITHVKYRNYNYIYSGTEVEILLCRLNDKIEVWLRDPKNEKIVFLKADLKF